MVVKELILLEEGIVLVAKLKKEILRIWYNTEQVSHKNKKDGYVLVEYKILKTGKIFLLY